MNTNGEKILTNLWAIHAAVREIAKSDKNDIHAPKLLQIDACLIEMLKLMWEQEE